MATITIYFRFENNVATVSIHHDVVYARMASKMMADITMAEVERVLTAHDLDMLEKEVGGRGEVEKALNRGLDEWFPVRNSPNPDTEYVADLIHIARANSELGISNRAPLTPPLVMWIEVAPGEYKKLEAMYKTADIPESSAERPYLLIPYTETPKTFHFSFGDKTISLSIFAKNVGDLMKALDIDFPGRSLDIWREMYTGKYTKLNPTYELARLAESSADYPYFLAPCGEFPDFKKNTIRCCCAKEHTGACEPIVFGSK